MSPDPDTDGPRSQSHNPSCCLTVVSNAVEPSLGGGGGGALWSAVTMAVVS